MDTFIVEFWSRVFGQLKRLSLFSLVRKLFPKIQRSYVFVEAWVLGNIGLSIISLFLVHYFRFPLLQYVLFFYGLTRVFEIVVYQVNVMFFDQYRARKHNTNKQNGYWLKGYLRTVILLMHNYFEIVLWFAVSYLILANQITGTTHASLIEHVYFSFTTMTSFGNGDLSTMTRVSMLIVSVQSLIGLFMTTLSLAYFINLLPTPKSIDESEK